MDKLLEHKESLFGFLKERWRDIFGAKFEVLLYDLTSTYFECDVPPAEGLRRFGYSRDKRGDCVQVVVGLIVTPEGFPLGYEVFAGNTLDRSTLRDMLKKIDGPWQICRCRHRSFAAAAPLAHFGWTIFAGKPVICPEWRRFPP